ncbi:MAG TPA: hypothetical protein PKA19_05585 [Bacillota bacterium]|nr:hypothetical protein [Bacillota bacterium]
MENSSTFWNKAAEWLESFGFPDVTGLEAMLIFLALFLVLLFALWLIFRKARLWYWKTDIQIDALKSIDDRLHSVETRLSEVPLKGILEAEPAEPAPEGESRPEEDLPENTAQESEGFIAVGRSGRIYREAELELQIRE